MNKKGLSAPSALVAGLLALACSSSSSSSPPPCNEDPFQCPAGQTCWAKDASTFACLPSGAGQYGDSCQPVAGTGTAPRGDGLVCVATTNAGGKCIHYCSPSGTAHTCSSGTCTAAAFGGPNGPLTYVCAGGASTTPVDGGAD
jgi:hypothetical protein